MEGLAGSSRRPCSGAEEPAGVAGSRVDGVHHAVTRSALDAVRRWAESGAEGRRREGDVRSERVVEVLVQPEQGGDVVRLHADPVFEHEFGEFDAVDGDDAHPHAVGIVEGLTGEGARGDEDASVGLLALECSDESLHGRSAHGAVSCVALRLDVDAVEAERVLADDAVDPSVGAVAGGLDVTRCAVLHRAKDLQNEVFEVLRRELRDAFEDLGDEGAVDRGDGGVDDLLGGIRVCYDFVGRGDGVGLALGAVGLATATSELLELVELREVGVGDWPGRLAQELATTGG